MYGSSSTKKIKRTNYCFRISRNSTNKHTCLWNVEKNSWEVKNGRYSIYWFYWKQGPEILSETLTNQNLECEDGDDEVYNADSHEPGTDDI